MAKSTETIDDLTALKDKDAFSNRLQKLPRQWAIVISARAGLRVLPLLFRERDPGLILGMFRAAAAAQYASRYPKTVSIGRIAAAAADAAASNSSVQAAIAYAAATVPMALSRSPGAPFARIASDATFSAIAAAEASDLRAAVRRDLELLYVQKVLPTVISTAPLWPSQAPISVIEGYKILRQYLLSQGRHWSVWIGWYDKVLIGAPQINTSEEEDAAFTDLPGGLLWRDGPESVNTEIVERLKKIEAAAADEAIPDQFPAPVRVEERDGKVSKASDRDSSLAASERDFRDWRDPVVDHIDELSAGDFSQGTNHGRVRDRLLAFSKLLPGAIADVKDRQFRIGYEVERFEGLLAAYRTGGDDMPVLTAAQLEDLDRLRVALKMGIDKLERWSDFCRQAGEGAEGGANAQAVADALEEMVADMERTPKFFDPELPASFRFLAEAARDRMGATKTVIYGAVKSAENLVSFLGRKAIGIGRKSADALEEHISKAVAKSLLIGLGAAALQLSGALPQGWAWLKPLLAAVGAG
uniref:Uncharacterized protein n=1 Tax=Rhodopseudomonas palustris (strain DX-1) TaxID=652103 RepID=E6VGZ8_RHOPX